MTAKQTPLVDLLRVHADDIHSAHGHNKSSTLLSRAADRIDALEAERDQLRSELAKCKRDAERYRLLRNHISWYDVDHDFDVEARNVPVLASVSAYVWYHATDVKGETLDDVVDALAAEGECT